MKSACFVKKILSTGIQEPTILYALVAQKNKRLMNLKTIESDFYVVVHTLKNTKLLGNFCHSLQRYSCIILTDRETSVFYEITQLLTDKILNGSL